MTKFIKTGESSAVRSGRSTIHSSASYSLIDNDGTVIANIKCINKIWRVHHLPSNQSALSLKFKDAKTLALEIHELFIKENQQPIERVST